MIAPGMEAASFFVLFVFAQARQTAPGSTPSFGMTWLRLTIRKLRLHLRHPPRMRRTRFGLTDFREYHKKDTAYSPVQAPKNNIYIIAKKCGLL